jgi:hypothetical protein
MASAGSIPRAPRGERGEDENQALLVDDEQTSGHGEYTEMRADVDVAYDGANALTKGAPVATSPRSDDAARHRLRGVRAY